MFALQSVFFNFHIFFHFHFHYMRYAYNTYILLDTNSKQLILHDTDDDAKPFNSHFFDFIELKIKGPCYKLAFTIVEPLTLSLYCLLISADISVHLSVSTSRPYSALRHMLW